MSTEDNGNDLPANWLGNTLPLNNGTEEFIFGPATRSSVTFYTDVNARKISITGITQPFRLDDDNEALTIGADGLVYAPATSLTSYLGAIPVIVPVNQTWNIQSGRLVLEYDVEGAGQITKTGAGTLAFEDTSSSLWTGGLTLTAGQIVVPAAFSTTPVVSNALGTGTLTFNGGSLVSSLGYNTTNPDAQALILPNAIVSNGLISVKGRVTTIFDGPGVTLNADTTIQATGRPLYIESAIVESGVRKLIVDSSAPVILQGSSGWTGGTEVINRGILIFDGEDNTPGGTGNIKVAADAYVGSSVTNNVGLFISEFDKTNTLGTIGFDTDLALSPGTLSAAIDLTGFNAGARLGSASRAILGSTATITPQETSYRFGGGGGWLQVNSLLTGARSLVLDSPASRPLTVRLTNDANNYTGGTSVTRSALIFGGFGGGSFSGGAGSILINQGGYVGFETWGDQTTQQMVDNSLPLINPTSTGMVGFETSISASINLGSFTGGIYLGTASPVNHDGDYYGGSSVSGLITTGNGGADPYRFAGYKGGRLVVSSTLSGAAGVKIGDPNSPGTFGDPVGEELSSVNLAGDNSGLTGDIALYGGRLEVDQGTGVVGTNPSTALGAGDLIVQGMSLPNEWKDANYSLPLPVLAAGSNGLIIANDIVLNSSLSLGGYNSFNVTGVISGTGGLEIEGENDGTIYNYHLGGNNTFGGGVYLYGNSNLYLNHNNALGTGALKFGFSTGGQVYFGTANPVIGGLASYQPDDYNTLYATQPNTVLTINQANNSWFAGEVRSNDLGDAMRVVKSGAGTLRLEDGGLYYHNGLIENSLPGTPQVSLEIQQGSVVIGQDFYIEGNAPTLWVHGGNLVLDNEDGYLISNPVVVDNGGKLAGNGFLTYGDLSIGTGATLSPGLSVIGGNPIGRLDFWHLNAKAGGTLEWDIMKADVNSQAWDQIFISTPSTLDFTTINLLDTPSAATRFTLKVISRTLTGAQGLLADFNPTLSYSWLLFETDGILNFDPAKVIIDTTLFANSLDAGAGNGYFFLAQNGNDLLLNFSPVPEPSTYALLLAGLAAVALGYRRRKHRA